VANTTRIHISLADNYRRFMRRPSISHSLVALAAVVAVVGGAACSSDADTDTSELPTNSVAESVSEPAQEPAAESVEEQRFPDVIDAEATVSSSGWNFAVTVSSPYDSPDRYADGWRILGPDGTEYGFRLLTHDHASEQPFTRTLDGVEIPDDVTTVTIEGRDQEFGFGGATFELTLPTS
jgi:hypothetical protein